MKLPGDLPAEDLVTALAKLGYEVTRQKGSHLRLTTQEPGEHHLTIPGHGPLRIGTLAGILADLAVQIGTLAGILADVAAHFGISREELAEKLWEKGSL